MTGEEIDMLKQWIPITDAPFGTEKKKQVDDP